MTHVNQQNVNKKIKKSAQYIGSLKNIDTSNSGAIHENMLMQVRTDMTIVVEVKNALVLYIYISVYM